MDRKTAKAAHADRSLGRIGATALLSGDVHMILVVEDEPSISEIVSLYLRRAGFEVAAVRDGQAALDFLARRSVELIVLDLMLPKVDGLEVTRRIRQRAETPIIMLTARNSEADRIAGLELGADDYVVKPFSPQELVSRVRAVLRRARTAPVEPSLDPPLEYDGLAIDPRTRLVTVDGEERVLTTKEFELLWALASNPRRAFNREQLLERAWGSADYIDPSTVTVHVRRLREKVERNPAEPRHIVTVWGHGYRFDP
ncbi:MAG: response regulator transcription factor [Thermoleophilia bacterium]